jgi:hypothetical protein
VSGSSSAVERQLPKLDVAGSIPVSRSISLKTSALAKQSPKVYRLNLYSGQGVAADFNRDGKLDVATANVTNCPAGQQSQSLAGIV